MKLSIQEIAKVLKIKTPEKRHTIRHVSIDSRQIVHAKQTLFFELTGRYTDGHTFIATLYKKGVRNFVVHKICTNQKFAQANFLVVKNTVQALQSLAMFYRSSLDAYVITVTGSNGKTVVKEWLASLLGQIAPTAKSPKSFNSQIGVPMSIFQIKPSDKYAILEAGISKPGEMQKLQKIIKADLGILTNIGSAHDEGFPNRQTKASEKLKLFTGVKGIVYNIDQKWSRQETLSKKVNRYTWSSKKRGFISNVKFEKQALKTIIRFECNGQPYDFEVGFTDDASLENSMQCITAAMALEISARKIQNGLDQLYAVEMRLQMLDGENQCTVINDAYTADIESLIAGLHFQERQHAEKQKTVILSDFLQTGKGSKKLYAQIADLLSENNVKKVIGIGKEVLILQNMLAAYTERYFFESTEAYLRHLESDKHINEIILVKGARRFQFEKIIEQLEKHMHEASLQVDLGAITHNVQYFKNKLKKKTKLLAMIKASGYGSGAIQIAGLLERSDVDYFGVAYVDEGIALRKKGITKPIMVLNTHSASFKALLNYSLEPEIFSMHQLDELIAFLPAHQQIKIHLKIDTGMHRLGFVQEEWSVLCERLVQSTKQIKVQSIFTHLAASDTMNEDAFSHSQMEEFNLAYKYITKRIKYNCDRHALNTSGILRFPQYQYEMVRLGIGLYGIDPTSEKEAELQEVMTFSASVSQIKHLETGDTIGYNRSGKVKKDKKIAIINVGYADGLLRKAGNGRFKVLINGKLAPTIGNICMDMSMIDISKIGNVALNDEVVIFGKNHSIQHLCKALDTIPYEVFTGVSERIKRVYNQE